MKRLLCLLIAGLCFAQEADIYTLNDADSKRVNDCWMQLKLAEAKWQEMRQSIKTEYRATCDVDFSRDFRAFMENGQNCKAK